MTREEIALQFILELMNRADEGSVLNATDHELRVKVAFQMADSFASIAGTATKPAVRAAIRAESFNELKDRINGRLVYEAITRHSVGNKGDWDAEPEHVQRHYGSIANFMRNSIE